MDRPPQLQDTYDGDESQFALPAVLLVAVAGILGAALGAALTVFAARTIGFYIPIVPGYLAASAIVRVHRSNAIWVGIVGGLCGFVGGLFAEAFFYVNPGVWHYVTHFYENASTMDWLFRAINAGVGYWFARSVPITAASGFPVAIPGTSCPHCGEGNLPNSQFCAQCGQPMN